jgi:hypothetical protein
LTLVQGTIKRFDLGDPELERARLVRPVAAEGYLHSTVCADLIDNLPVCAPPKYLLFCKENEARTRNVAHLMVVEHGLAACVASHVLGVDLLVVLDRGPSDEWEGSTGLIGLAHCNIFVIKI